MGLTFDDNELGVAAFCDVDDAPFDRLFSSISDWTGESDAGWSMRRSLEAMLRRRLEMGRGSVNAMGWMTKATGVQ